MTERPLRDDWHPYRADDPSTYPVERPLTGEWCYEVTRRWMEYHIVELAGGFRAADRPACRWISMHPSVSIPNVVAWRILWFSAPWMPKRNGE